MFMTCIAISVVSSSGGGRWLPVLSEEKGQSCLPDSQSCRWLNKSVNQGGCQSIQFNSIALFQTQQYSMHTSST